MAGPSAYEAMATQALVELAETEGAFVMPEAEAKIADRRWPSVAKPVNPHHITPALNALITAHELVATDESTRGGRTIRVYHQPVVRGIGRKIIDASARKRLLHTRYQAWASGSKDRGQGAIGPGLEAVVHRSLTEAAPFGYRLFNPTSVLGEVRELFGQPVPGGSLDNGGWLTVPDPDTGMPKTYLMILEAKNLRQWIYPRTQELHQLLAKASAIQVAHPDVALVPVLVCRRAQYLTAVMAEQLGFYVIQTHRQYVRPYLVETEKDQRMFDEVNNELAYDLVPHGDAVDPMVRHFRTPIQNVAERTASRWGTHAAATADTFATLRNDRLSYADRATALDELAELAEAELGEAITWRRPADHDEPEYDEWGDDRV